MGYNVLNVKIRCRHCFLKIACGDDFKGSEVACPGCKTAIRIPTPSYNTGEKVFDYTIEQWLGNGAMGEVYLARQESMDRLVALKIINQQKLQNKEDKQRFVREVRLLANLNHPNIVTAIEAGDFQNTAFLAMRYVYGTTAEDKILKDGPFSEQLALKVCMTIAHALDHAWAKCKLIHRDLKPANFMIDRDNIIHLMDLGIAKRVGLDGTLGDGEYVMGTPFYMSPEQARGKDLDLRSDMYSLGASLYHMLTGHAPYEKMITSNSIMSEKLHKPPTNPLEYNPNISKPVLDFLNNIMAIDINQRPNDWQEVKDKIKDTLKKRSLQSSSSNHSISEIKKKTTKKSPITIVIFAGISIVVFLFIYLLLRQ
jgi:serine/threonine protein kinase